MTAVTRDQFETHGKQLIHLPTGARFTVSGDNTEWGSAGLFRSNGDDYQRKDVLQMAMHIMRETATGRA